MKKLMFIMALILVAVSCQEPETFPDFKELSADPLALSFDAEGGTEQIIVSVLNIEFDVTPSADWIEYSENTTRLSPPAPHTIYIDVTVGENTGALRAGTITLSGEGVEDVVITVTQKAKEVVVSNIIWDGSHAALMNLKGPVKTASYHYSFVYDVEDTLFEFDADGYVTSFRHTKFNNDEVPVTVTYDTDKRITGIEGKGTEDFLISLEYGDHGQYIPIEEVFYTVSEMQVVSNMLWMPRLIKNLAKITLADNNAPSKNMTLVYTVDDGNGSLQYTDGSGTVTEDFHKLTFENGFVKTLTYDLYGGEAVATYTIAPETGHIIAKDQEDRWGVLSFEFNSDAINSMKSIDDGYGVFHYDYNADLDLVEVLDGDTVDTTISYEYDQQRNWVVMTVDAEAPVERTVTYW